MEIAPIGASAVSALWTFPAILLAAFLLAWAAEAAQSFISQALALALLAWLQTLPEFSIEGVIAWHRDVPLMAANFTGAIRLLVGLGWPMVFAVRAFAVRRNLRDATITLTDENSMEVMSLLPPMLYFAWIIFKGSLTVADAAVLLGLYGGYFWLVSRLPSRQEEDLSELPRVSRWALTRRGALKYFAVAGLFVAGGVLLGVAAEPFVGSMQGLAVVMGVPAFIFVQWVAPLLSEFPEKVSAFAWARTGRKAPMAMMNMVSSNINEWTVLASVLPIVYSISSGHVAPVEFDSHQRLELALTLAQSLLGFLFLLNLEFRWHEAAGLFILWAVQFALPDTHVPVIGAYLAWAALEVLLLLAGRRKARALGAFKAQWRLHVQRTHPA